MMIFNKQRIVGITDNVMAEMDYQMSARPGSLKFKKLIFLSVLLRNYFCVPSTSEIIYGPYNGPVLKL